MNDRLTFPADGFAEFADRLQTPLWIFDIERRGMLWANRAGVALWGVGSRAELIARDFGADMSAAVRLRLDNYLAAFRRGESLTESWTFFPAGEPVSVFCRCSGYRFDDGRIAMLVEGNPMDAIDAPTLRAVEALRHTAVMVSVYDSEGNLLTRNPAAEAVLDNRSLFADYLESPPAAAWAELGAREEYHAELLVRTRSGPRWHRVDLRRTPDPENGSPMIVVSEIDVTERHRSVDALTESEQRLREITDVLTEGVYLVNREGEIEFVNPAAAEMLGWSAAELVGRAAHPTFHYSRPDGSGCDEAECPALQAVVHGRVHHSPEDYFVRRDGTSLPVAIASAPLFRGEEVIGAVSAFHDISERKAVLRALKERERSLAEAQRIAHIGNWDWDVPSGRIHWSDEIYRIFGLEPQQFEPTYEAFMERVHPDDRAAVQAAVDRVLGSEGAYSVEHRIVRPDGSERVVLERSDMTRRQGGALRMIGTVQDITGQKMAQRALETAHRRLAALIENLSGGVLVEDEARRIVLVNQPFCDLFGMPASPPALVGADCAGAAAQSAPLFRDPEGFVRRIDQILAARETVAREELAMADGRIVERDYVPVFLGDEYHGHLWQYRDITERKEAERRLRRLATTDELTGLFNRRHTLEHLATDLARAQRSGRATSLLLMDLDHFKQINDNWGHAAGDRALQCFAEAVRGGLRAGDAAGRVGGEEFLLILPDSDHRAGVEVAERLRQQVAAIAVTSNGAEFSMSVSIGMTTFPHPDDAVESIMARADRALYAAKAAGRDRVCAAENEPA